MSNMNCSKCGRVHHPYPTSGYNVTMICTICGVLFSLCPTCYAGAGYFYDIKDKITGNKFKCVTCLRNEKIECLCC